MAVSISTNAAEKGRPQAPMSFLGLCLHNLTGRPLRSSLTVLGIGVAIGSFIALTGTSRGFERALVGGLLGHGTDIVATRMGVVDPLSVSLDESIAEKLRRVEGVQAVAGELVNLVRIEPGHTMIATAWDPASYLWRTLTLSSGALPDRTRPDGIVLGEALAEALHVRVGDALSVNGEDFIVSALSRHSGAVDKNVLVMQLPAMQGLMDRPGKVTFFNLRVRGADSRDRVNALRQSLSREFPSLQFVITGEVAENDAILRFMRTTAWAVSLIALVMGTLVTLNTLLMSVAERTYDLGVLSAIGWGGGRILAMVVVEGTILALAGGVVGCLLGSGVLCLLASLPQLNALLEAGITPLSVLEVLCAVLLISLLGGLYPAWRAVRLNPVESLRHS